MVLNTKMLLAVITFITATVLMVGSAFAAPALTRPGWGYGDTNHVHTGPPGLSVRQNASVSDQANVNVVTGGNSVHGNNRGTNSVKTGDANILVRFVNFLNNAIFHFGK